MCTRAAIWIRCAAFHTTTALVAIGEQNIWSEHNRANCESSWPIAFGAANVFSRIVNGNVVYHSIVIQSSISIPIISTIHNLHSVRRLCSIVCFSFSVSSHRSQAPVYLVEEMLPAATISINNNQTITTQTYDELTSRQRCATIMVDGHFLGEKSF